MARQPWKTQLKGSIPVVTKRTLIPIATPTGLWAVRYENYGGRLPVELEGLWTTEQGAEGAILSYNTRMGRA